MTKIQAFGKYLDQPILTAKLNKNVPYILAGTSALYAAKQVSAAPKEEKKKAGLKSALILASTAISAIFAPKIASKMTGRKASKTLNDIKEYNKNIVDNYVKNSSDAKINNILQKSKTDILSLGEVSALFHSKKDKAIANELIPPPDNIQSKDIFKEIGWLSIYGAVPVVGGITGGVLADKFTEQNWKMKIPDKVNEGVYQYLANIFLCNVGAGIALGCLEKASIKSKTARCIGMISGILVTGVIGGSMMANYIGNKFINPVILKKESKESRTPEILDLGLHTDDIATVSLLSGLKWIEPSLPLLYAISGYRAGIGYRNNKISEQKTA